MNGHDCIGNACAICHPRCECHACTQARAQERNPFLGGNLYTRVTCQYCLLPIDQPQAHGDGKCNIWTHNVSK